MQFHINQNEFHFDDNIFAFKWLHCTNWHVQEIFSGVQCRSKNPSYTGIGHFQSIKTDVWLNFLKTTNTIRIGFSAFLTSILYITNS